MTNETKNFCSFGRIRAAAKFADGHVAAIKAVHGHLDRNPERYPVIAYFWTESTDPSRPGYEPQPLYSIEAVENMMADVASGAFAPRAGYRTSAAPVPAAKAPLTAAEKAAAAEAEEAAAKAALEQAEKALEQARARLKDAQSAAALARADAEKVAAEAAEKALTAAKAAAASLSAADLAALLKEARAAEKAAVKTE